MSTFKYNDTEFAVSASGKAWDITRKLPNGSLAEWKANKPSLHMARGHLERVIRCAPASCRARTRGGNAAS